MRSTTLAQASLEATPVGSAGTHRGSVRSGHVCASASAPTQAQAPRWLNPGGRRVLLQVGDWSEQHYRPGSPGGDDAEAFDDRSGAGLLARLRQAPSHRGVALGRRCAHRFSARPSRKALVPSSGRTASSPGGAGASCGRQCAPPNRRVDPAPFGAGPPSEPDVPVSEHPAQASSGASGWAGVLVDGRW
jgi:hypothetical protein